MWLSCWINCWNQHSCKVVYLERFMNIGSSLIVYSSGFFSMTFPFALS